MEPLLLDDIDLTKTQSHRWQTEASVPEKKFETFLAETRDAGIDHRPPTRIGGDARLFDQSRRHATAIITRRFART